MNERKNKHLTLNERYVIERMLNKGYKKKEIADAVGCCLATVYNEIKRATYMHTIDYRDVPRYAPEIAHQKYRAMLKLKGRKPKLAVDTKQKEAIEQVILEKKYSPAAALVYISQNDMERDFLMPVKSVNTIYSAIESGLFESLQLKQLPCGGRYKAKKKKKVTPTKSASKGTSIERRPDEVKTRGEFGNWEMDTVKGKSTNKKCLLVLAERKTRFEIIEVLKSCTTAEVIHALNRIEKRYGSSFFSIFKTITVDNGTEFSDHVGMEKALYRVGKRTDVYFCHPHCPHERGSNEVQNKLIRRFFPKGSDFDATVNRNDVKAAENWMNEMPRKLFDGKSAAELFSECCVNIVNAT